MKNAPPRLHVLMTTHNRPGVTQHCLQALRRALDRTPWTGELIIVDSSTNNETRLAINKYWPSAIFIPVTEDVYWAKGMSIAEEAANAICPSRQDCFLLWLNDDVVLDPDALCRLEAWHTKHKLPIETIVVGSMRGSDGELTYGGLQKGNRGPLDFRLIIPAAMSSTVHTFHGNFVLVSHPWARQIGGIDGDFQHHSADLDFGLRNSDAGGLNLLLPGSFGTCERPKLEARSARVEWLEYHGLKGAGNPRTRLRFLVRHKGWFAGTFWLALMEIHFIGRWVVKFLADLLPR